MKILPVEEGHVLMRRLMAHVPAGVAALQRIHHAGEVADVARVVEGEKVAVFIEGEFLRIAQTFAKQLETAAVGLAAKDRPATGSRDDLAVFRRDVIAAIANGKIEPTIRAARDAVEIVADEGNAHAEARGDGFLGIRDTVIVLVCQLPHIRNAGEINRVVLREHREADAVERFVKPI